MRVAAITLLCILLGVPLASATLRASEEARSLQAATCSINLRLRSEECSKEVALEELENERDEAREDGREKRAAKLQACIDDVNSGAIDVDGECAAANSAVSLTEAFEQSDDQFSLNIDEFFAGDTELNTNTGPLACDALLIPDVRNHAAKKSVIASPMTCEDPIMMCTWIRDRQPRDGNGDCATPLHENCVNKGPGDNTDLCMVADDDEGNIHAHGFVYHPGTPEADYAGNMLFYVSLYDHMYKRGYVENVDYGEGNVYPMCGCLSDMPKVSRADCTEISVDRDEYMIAFRPASGLTIRRRLRLSFDACDGRDDDDNTNGGPGDENDLYSEIVAVYGGENNVPDFVDQDNDDATDNLVGACKAGDVTVTV